MNRLVMFLASTETSKVILIVVGIATGIVTLFTLIITAITGDLSALTVLIGCVFAACSTALGFYYNKAKTENKIKLMQIYGSETVNNCTEPEESEDIV